MLKSTSTRPFVAPEYERSLKARKSILPAIVPAILPAVIPPVVLGVSVEVSANNLHLDKFWFRDYLDFGQNKGMFVPGATGLSIMDKNGNMLELPNVPFPDFSPVSNTGPTTYVGGGFAVTAAHNKKWGAWKKDVGEPFWGISSYGMHERPIYQPNYNTKPDEAAIHDDFAIVRLNKYVVETPGYTDAVDVTLNNQEFLDRYGVVYNGKKMVLAYRAGAGVLYTTYKGKKTEFKSADYRSELLSGSIYRLNSWNPGGDRADFVKLFDFYNETTGGDSGSAVLLWDNKLQKWVIAGVLFGIGGGSSGVNYMIYSKWHPASVQKFKDRYTHKVLLNQGNLLFSATTDREYTLAGAQKTIDRHRDMTFTGGGLITLQKNLDLGVGGLVFDENRNYTVEGSNFTYRGAGIDIGKGTKVNWSIKGDPNDNLHKVGEGTLIVNESQGNNLKVGNGTVELVAQQSFNQIYMASGLATIKLRHQDALKKDDKFNNIYFTTRGGTLDLNGHSQKFQRIAASDAGTVITNTANTRADLDLTLPTWKYAYHGRFTEGLNVNVKFDSEASSADKFEKRHLILDGGMSIHGDMTVKNARVTMQGLPTRHAIQGKQKCHTPGVICDPYWMNHVTSFDKEANDRFNSHYKNDNQPNSLQQPDWETRTYQFGTLKLENAEIGVGRNSRILGNIDAVNSNIQFGGDTAVFRDYFQGDNVTAAGNGFDFRQQLHQGKSQADDTIYYEGRIKASNSHFTSTMQSFSASFDLKDGSTFKSLNSSSVTRIMDEGIKVSGKSELVLGDIFVTGNTNKNLISVSTDSKMSVQNVHVSEGMLYVPDYIAQGALNAFNNGSIYVHHWTLDSNLRSDATGKIYIDNLTTAGTQRADANITVNNELFMGDLNPGHVNSRASEWVGLDVTSLTLEPTAHIKADFSNDYLSLTNVSFNEEQVLLRAGELKDERLNKDISFTSGGEDIDVDTRSEGNQIFFTFKDLNPDNRPDTDPDAGPEGGEDGEDGNGNGPVDMPPALHQFLQTSTNPRAEQIISAIITHNEKSPDKYQEVALKDALSNKDPQAGAQALAAIVERTDNMKQAAARTLKKSTVIAPVRGAIDSRLASLRRPVRSATATYTPVAAAGDAASAMAMSRKTDEQILNDSMFVDISTGLQKDGTRKERVVSSNLGFDRVLEVERGRMVLGGAFSVTSVDNTDEGASDEGMMYSLTGYMSLEQKNGFELQSYLTGGYLMNDRSMTPEVSLGEQTFDERSFMLMSSNYFKYHFKKGEYSIKPMILADLGFNRVNKSESDYIKRDSMNQVTLDLGVGVELEGAHESWGYMLQATARNNVWNSNDKVGVNLTSAEGYISYEIPGEHETSFSLNGSVSKRLAADITVDLGLGASATTDGAHGLNANARIRWHF